MSTDQLPRILRKRGDPEYPTFVELFFDLAYIFVFQRLAETLVEESSPLAVAQVTVSLLAVWWVWVLTAWLTDLFDPRLAIIRNLVITVMVGVIVMAAAIPRAFEDLGLVFVLAYFAIHLARDAVLIPGTRVNPGIQARSIRVFFWLGVSGVPWLAGAFVHGTPRLVLWAAAVFIDFASARIGWPTPRLGHTDLSSRVFTAPHLSERHRQIVIVAFGELILTASIGLTSGGLGALRIAVFATMIASAIALFQLYFQQMSRMREPEESVRVEHVGPGTFASYWHLLMVAGVIGISVGARTITADPFGHVTMTRILVILGGPALFLLGSCLLDWSVKGWLPWVRLIAALTSLAITPAMRPLPALLIVVVGDSILLLTLFVEGVFKGLRPGPASQASTA